MEIKTVYDQLLFATFLLQTGNSSATGFAYRTEKDTLIVISNRHFAEQTDELDFSRKTIKQSVLLPIHLKNGEVVLTKETVDWYLHPTEDLAFFNLSQIINKHNFDSFVISINKNNIPTTNDLEGLDVVNDVIMVGYPNGMYDKFSYYPLFRVGKTAYHPLFNFCGFKHGIVDMACLPGSSGSPIFIFNDGGYTDRKTNETFLGKSRLLFLGIEFSMPVRYNQEVYEKTSQEGVLKETNFVVREDMNYGNYIKSSEILAFEDMFLDLGI